MNQNEIKKALKQIGEKVIQKIGSKDSKMYNRSCQKKPKLGTELILKIRI